MKRRISRRVVGVVSAVALVVIAALAIALFSHSIEPAARRSHNQWADFATVYGRLHNGNGRTVRNGDVLLCGHACFSARATLNEMCIRDRFFGSYGWSGGAQKELDELVERSKCKWQFIESAEFQGRPSADDIALICDRGRELAQQVQAWVQGG